ERRLGWDLDVRRRRVRFRNRKPFFPETVQMKRDGVLHLALNIVLRSGRRNASGKVGRVRRVTGRSLLNHDQVLHGFSPACFKTLFSVPGARSSPGFPATVTSPGFDA